MSDLTEAHALQVERCLTEVSRRLLAASDRVDQLRQRGLRTDLRTLDERWSPTVADAVHEVLALVGNLGALDRAVRAAAEHDTLVGKGHQ